MQYRRNIAGIYKGAVYGSGARRNGGAIPQTVSITHYEKGRRVGREEIAGTNYILTEKFIAMAMHLATEVVNPRPLPGNQIPARTFS